MSPWNAANGFSRLAVVHACLIGGFALLFAVLRDLISGPLASEMMNHILAMGVAAPMVAIFITRERRMGGKPRLAAATAAMIVTFTLWHAPAAMAASMSHPLAAAAMHVTMFGSSLWFWTEVIRQARRSPWPAVAALLAAGKVFCLVAILMVFSRHAAFHAPGHKLGAPDLADQQLAGLLMVVACPLVYVSASIAIVARWLLQPARAA